MQSVLDIESFYTKKNVEINWLLVAITRQHKFSLDIELKKHNAVSLTQFLCRCSLDKSRMFLAYRSHQNNHFRCRKNGWSELIHRWCIETLSEQINWNFFWRGWRLDRNVADI